MRRRGSTTPPIESAWTAIGFIVAEVGGLLLVVSLVLGAIGMRRLGSGGGRGLLSATMVISLLLLAAYAFAVWAMSGKPD